MPTGPGQGGGSQFPSPRIPPRFRALVMGAAMATQIPPKIIATQLDYESSWNPKATSPTGARGIAQFEPSAWAQYGSGAFSNAYQVKPSFLAYKKFMGSLIRSESGDIRNALAAYNAGPGNLQAGYPYADTILSSAGYGPDVHAHYRGGSQTGVYENPLRGVQSLAASRIDQGVDYSGTGPIYAIGPGTIVQTTNTGWPGGAFIAERISKGALAGHYWYAAENIAPSVRVGQKVDTSTQIGTVTGGIETGIGAPPPDVGESLAVATGNWNPQKPSTSEGWAASGILGYLGAPTGTLQNPPTGSLPTWLNKIMEDTGLLAKKIPGSGGESSLGRIADAIGSVADAVGKFGQIIDWLVNPAHWVRIIAGVGGGVLLIFGLWTLTHVGEKPGGSLAGPAEPSASLPLGILMVGAGGVGLFVAFHNLPSDVTDFPSLLGYFRTSAANPSAGGSSLNPVGTGGP